MNDRPELLMEVARWTEKAEHDLLAARQILAGPENTLADIVCFHAQQCAEKYMKALLLYHGVAFPKTHDLRFLWDLLPAGLLSDLRREQVIPLNRYVIEGRYPGDWEPITEDEARDALEMAGAVRRAVIARLP